MHNVEDPASSAAEEKNDEIMRVGRTVINSAGRYRHQSGY